jgi:2-isopropylmalate synthase
VEVEGNGRLDCVSSAIKEVTGKIFVLENYVEHALEEKSSSKAASYICVVSEGKSYWGAGIHTDIMTSSVRALVSAVNRLLS